MTHFTRFVGLSFRSSPSGPSSSPIARFLRDPASLRSALTIFTIWGSNGVMRFNCSMSRSLGCNICRLCVSLGPSWTGEGQMVSSDVMRCSTWRWRKLGASRKKLVGLHFLPLSPFTDERTIFKSWGWWNSYRPTVGSSQHLYKFKRKILQSIPNWS